MDRTANGVKNIRESLRIRREITDLYRIYRALTNTVTNAAQSAVSAHSFKRVVDALYYLGGGWPTENSKGRMEALLDDFVGMYRVLEFIGKGDIVHEHLAQHGVTITLAPENRIQNFELSPNDKKALSTEYNWLAITSYGEYPNDLRELITIAVMTCEDLQGEICQLADESKGLNKMAKIELEVQDEELDRLNLILKVSTGTEKSEEKVLQKRAAISDSWSKFNKALKYARE